jgi:hypothetical protein
MSYNQTRLADLKEILSNEIQSPDYDDLEHRMYIKRMPAEHNRPTIPYVPTPMDGINPLTNGGQMYSDLNNRHQPLQKSEIGVEDYYMLFDSFNKTRESSPSEGLYVYDISKINDNFMIKHIIEMEIQDFIVPVIPVLSYQPNYFRFGTVMIDIENIVSQQHGSGCNTHFHFNMNISDDNVGLNRILLKGTHNNKYIFKDPIRDISRAEFRFKSPISNVPFLQDVFAVMTVSSGGPSPANRQLKTSIPHNMTIGSIQDVYFKNYNATDSILNSVVNNIYGHKVDIIDAYTVQLTNSPGSDAIGTAITSTGTLPTCAMFIADRRIAFTIRFRSIVTMITNFISP